MKGYDRISDTDLEGNPREQTPLSSRALNSDKPFSLARLAGVLFTIGSVALVLLLFSLGPNDWAPSEVLGADSGTVAATGATGSAGLFDWAGRYVLRNYDTSSPMANFLPGLGGYWGVPMWAFYVNRGQAMVSLGVGNKDGSIAKYNTAEKTYQQVVFDGFRTFIRGSRGKQSFSHMPFFIGDPEPGTRERHMAVGMNSLEITEIDSTLELNTTVSYFTVTDEDFPAMVRRTVFTNMHSSDTLHMDVLDGLAKLEPSGLSNFNLDSMGRTMEAWMNVYNMNDTHHTQPFYHISQGTADTTQVQIINDGHFVIAFVENEAEDYTVDDLLPFIVDPRIVFKTDTTLTNPAGFTDRDGDFSRFMGQRQTTVSRTPSAFAGAKISVAPKKSVGITSIYGHAKDLDHFLEVITPKLLSKQFVTTKFKHARELVFSLTSFVKTTTSNPVFDMYVEQDFLDNILRGGIPVNVGDKKRPMIFHTFSRIHGDLERDYNPFQIDPTYFSQGPGNFRDVNQNRRNDVMHVPIMGDFNVRTFLSFVQADGYNPLTVAGTNFRLSSSDADAVVAQCIFPKEETDSPDKLKLLLTNSFRIGDLYSKISLQKITIGLAREEFLKLVMDRADQAYAAQYAPMQGGFWADHWTYTLDLVDNYVYVFPDKTEHLLFDAEPVPFFMSPAIVNDRKHRYSLCPNPNDPGQQTICAYKSVCQWGDVSNCFPQNRIDAMNQIFKSHEFIVDAAGAGNVWQQDKSGKPVTVSVLAKFLVLGAIKFSTLDPLGMGVEYEGGKPGWNDAMNGLPGLVGSGMPETFEMLRVLNFLNQSLATYSRPLTVPTEFSDFLHGMRHILTDFFAEYPDGSSDKATNMAAVEFAFWNASNAVREEYRKSIVGNFKGSDVDWSAADLLGLLRMMILKANAGIQRALAMTPGGQTPTYFYYQADDFYVLPNREPVPPPQVPAPYVFARSFKVHTVPLFLEGPTRHMKVIQSTDKKREVYQKSKASGLYDATLGMFKISENLKSCVQNIGRMMAFAAGWLENESVWLHMSYKFYLELIRGGLFEEFFDELQTGLVPFMDPVKYGRSPVEASSFIVPTVFPDETLHGTGFLARLSGSTAEFLSMWALMMAGSQPFFVDHTGSVNLQFLPNLPAWMFTKDANLVSFTFLGHTLVSYHNPAMVNTWNVVPKYANLRFDNGSEISATRAVFRGEEVVNLVREQKVASIDVFF